MRLHHVTKCIVLIAAASLSASCETSKVVGNNPLGVSRADFPVAREWWLSPWIVEKPVCGTAFQVSPMGIWTTGHLSQLDVDRGQNPVLGSPFSQRRR